VFVLPGEGQIIPLPRWDGCFFGEIRTNIVDFSANLVYISLYEDNQCIRAGRMVA
jgi:hypothetical protein